MPLGSWGITFLSNKDKKTTKAEIEGVQSKSKSKMSNYAINKIAVCKEVFKSTFSINNGRLRRLPSNHDRSPNDLSKDKRGPKENQGVHTQVIKTIIKIVKKIPKYTSHYPREKECSLIGI